MTSHLAENDFLRHVLQLSPKLVQPAGAAVAKEAKLEQKLLNAATFKARTSSRSHKRDKRSAVIAWDSFYSKLLIPVIVGYI